MKSFFSRYKMDITGAVTVEYAIIAALVSLGGLKSAYCIAVHCIAPSFEALARFMS